MVRQDAGRSSPFLGIKGKPKNDEANWMRIKLGCGRRRLLKSLPVSDGCESYGNLNYS